MFMRYWDKKRHFNKNNYFTCFVRKQFRTLIFYDQNMWNQHMIDCWEWKKNQFVAVTSCDETTTATTLDDALSSEMKDQAEGVMKTIDGALAK